MSDNFVLDLDAERKARAAQREGQREPLRIQFGDQHVATLPVELPLDVLTPLRNLDEDITLMIRTAMKAAQSQSQEDRWAQTQLVIDLLAANPRLPVSLLDTVGTIATSLFGQQGMETLKGLRLTREDLGVLASHIFRFYGVTLGEASEPSGLPEGNSGETSKPTSSTTTDSTPEESGPAQVSPAPASQPSSVSAVS